ncbi:MAG: phenylacetic acid degradation operon negative regulatory protein PaaX [Acidimicrobiia bacterium]|nr:phenylacetic acid degradation operon negative regulatory protein PaaX [Acidimicrobiia bacterium]
MTNLSAEARQWGGLSSTSARSVLVTILGDSVAPLGGEVWLADLFDLTQPFGFSQRLVRTSMYRLVNENWLENERVGRRSRYRLTAYARLECADADRRIYRRNPRNWDGVWSLVLGDTVVTNDADKRTLAKHLKWHGFVEIGRGVWAIPEPELETANELLDRLDLDVRPPVAKARFDRLEELVERGLFRSSFELTTAESAYQGFVDRYRPISRSPLTSSSPLEAFALRTMVVHDLRRVRLIDPDLPPALLPDEWIGTEAFDLAGRLYRTVAAKAWSAVEDVTDLCLSRADSRLERRFAPPLSS